MTKKCDICGKFCTTDGKCAHNCETKKPKQNQMEFSGKFELPMFLADDVELWWKQVDIRLELIGLTTESQKFRYVSSTLPAKAIKVASDLIRSEPESNPYTTLKNRVIEEFEPTSTAKIRKLLEGCTLGDRKATALLREMRQLNAGRVNDDVLRELFFAALPKDIRQILVTTRVTDLDDAAQATDQSLGINRQGPEINTVAASTNDNSRMSNLIKTVETLIGAVNQLNIGNRSRSRS